MLWFECRILRSLVLFLFPFVKIPVWHECLRSRSLCSFSSAWILLWNFGIFGAGICGKEAFGRCTKSALAYPLKDCHERCSNFSCGRRMFKTDSKQFVPNFSSQRTYHQSDCQLHASSLHVIYVLFLTDDARRPGMKRPFLSICHNRSCHPGNISALQPVAMCMRLRVNLKRSQECFDNLHGRRGCWGRLRPFARHFLEGKELPDLSRK